MNVIDDTELLRRYADLRIGVNAARDLRRHPRRRGRSLEGEIPAGWPPVEAIADREESAISLARELEALPPKLREPLVLRYFEQLDLSEIAQTLEVPKSTVHARCQRGLDHLRGRLRSPESARWIVALEGACAGLLRESPGLGSTLLSFAGGLAVSTKSLLASAVIGATLLAAWMLARGEDPEPAPGDELRPRSADVSEPEKRELRRDEPHPSLETSPFEAAGSEARGGLRIEGRVVDAAARALSGAAVTLRRHRGWWEQGSLESVMDELRLRSDERGSFRARLPEARGVTTLEISAGAPGHVVARVTRPLAAGGRLDQTITVELRPLDATIFGRITDTEGAPVAGAFIEWRDGRAQTDDAGRYRLRVASRRRLRVNAFGPRAGNATRVLDEVAPGAEIPLDFRLGASWGLRGRVVDAAGSPLAGALVRGFGTRRFAVRTEASGEFAVDGLSRARQHTVLLIEAPGRPRVLKVVTRELPVARPAIELARGHELSGLVVDREGRPIHGATVAVGAGLDELRTQKTLSDLRGGFRFDAAPPGRHELHVIAEGYAERISRIAIPSASPHRIVLEAGHTLLGRVVDSRGIPVAGASVQARLGSWYAAARVKTGEDGGFDFPDLPPRPLKLEINASGFRHGEFEATFQAGRQEFTLERSARLHGRVVVDANGAPVTSFDVRLFQADLGPDDEAGTDYAASLESRGGSFTREDGSWSIDDQGFAAGSFLGVEVRAAGFAPSRHRRVRASDDPGAPPLITRLVRACSIAGEVTSARTGGALAGATVQWIEADRWREHGAESRHQAGPRTQTTSRGEFRLEELVPGRGVLVITHPDHVTTASEVLVAGSPLGPVRLVADAGATLEGRLSDATGTVVAGGRVHLAPLPGTAGDERDLRTDEEGRFVTLGLAPGRWSAAWFEDHGNVSIARLTRQFDVPKAPAKVELRLRPTGAGRLRLRTEGRQPLPADLWVSLAPRGEHQAPVWRNEPLPSADVTLEGLSPGRWSVTVHSRSDPMRAARGQVEVGPTGTASLTLRLDEVRRW